MHSTRYGRQRHLVFRIVLFNQPKLSASCGPRRPCKGFERRAPTPIKRSRRAHARASPRHLEAKAPRPCPRAPRGRRRDIWRPRRRAYARARLAGAAATSGGQGAAPMPARTSPAPPRQLIAPWRLGFPNSPMAQVSNCATRCPPGWLGPSARDLGKLGTREMLEAPER